MSMKGKIDMEERWRASEKVWSFMVDQVMESLCGEGEYGHAEHGQTMTRENLRKIEGVVTRTLDARLRNALIA